MKQTAHRLGVEKLEETGLRAKRVKEQVGYEHDRHPKTEKERMRIWFGADGSRGKTRMTRVRRKKVREFNHEWEREEGGKALNACTSAAQVCKLNQLPSRITSLD